LPACADSLAFDLAFVYQFVNIIKTHHVPAVAVMTNVTKANAIVDITTKKDMTM
jgi:hypothetical protein